jgi:hypothetical protein
MQSDILSFVKLKYEILTRSMNTWDLCKIYPDEVRIKWAWRCAADVEHFAKGYPAAEECIRVAKAYRDGLATSEELEDSYSGIKDSAATSSFAAASAACAAIAGAIAGDLVAAHAAFYSVEAFNDNEKWNQYIDWLIEELCEYELRKNI